MGHAEMQLEAASTSTEYIYQNLDISLGAHKDSATKQRTVRRLTRLGHTHLPVLIAGILQQVLTRLCGLSFEILCLEGAVPNYVIATGACNRRFS